MAGASPRLKGRRGRFGPDGLVPTIKILSPGEGDIVLQGGGGFTATGEAFDDLTGDVTANIVWTSDVDGSVGANGSPTTLTLSSGGAHVITASITVGGDTVVDTINVDAQP